VEKKLGQVSAKMKSARRQSGSASWRSNHGHSRGARNAMTDAAQALSQIANKKSTSNSPDNSMMLLLLERMDKSDEARAKDARDAEERRAQAEHRRDLLTIKQTAITNTMLAKALGLKEVVDLISPDLSPPRRADRSPSASGAARGGRGSPARGGRGSPDRVRRGSPSGGLPLFTP